MNITVASAVVIGVLGGAGVVEVVAEGETHGEEEVVGGGEIVEEGGGSGGEEGEEEEVIEGDKCNECHYSRIRIGRISF